MILEYNRSIQTQTSTGAFNTYTRSNHQQGYLQMTTSSIPRTSGIYKITCTANGKIYIGSAVNLRKRWIQHKIDLRGQYHANSYLQNSFNKYGEEAFIFEILELVMPWSLLDREQYWLDTLRPYNRSVGFNLAVNSTSPMKGRKASDQTKAKQSAIRTGRKQSQEEKDKRAATIKGQKRTPETCANISASLKGRKMSPESISKSATSRTGLKRSLEANEKTGIANSKTYIITTPKGDEFEILNLSKFSRDNGLGDLVNVACGKRKHCKGWKCRKA